MKTNTLSWNVLRLLLVVVLLSGCGGRPSPQPNVIPVIPTPTPTVQPTNTTLPNSAVSLLKKAGPWSPVVLQSSISDGELSGGSAIEVRFDQPMDPSSTGKALTLTDAAGVPVSGQLEWPAADRFQFQPAQPLQPGASYHLTIGAQAASAKGVALSDSLTLPFRMAGAI